MSVRSSDVMIKSINGFLIDLPSPSSLTYMWNFGSLLGLFLGFQIISGLFLAFQFSGDSVLSFYSVVHMMRDVNLGWVMRVIHANGASFFFLFMYFHIGRGLYYGSYMNMKTWFSGVSIFLLSMATAFLGYVLPWGQMSFWAATVITNLLSVIPYVGKVVVEWVWGGFAVGNPTLIRFFGFHFVLPFVILGFVVVHLIFLHENGSSNMMGVKSYMDKVMFHPYYVIKDIYGLFVVIIVLMLICLENPYMFMDVENFIECNPLVTPVHIQPEWYFLFAYAILRSISSKIGGVCALVMSIVLLYFLPLVMNSRVVGCTMSPIMKVLFWYIVVNWMILTWLGSCEVIEPYSMMGGVFSFFYFVMFVLMWFISEVYNNMMWLY